MSVRTDAERVSQAYKICEPVEEQERARAQQSFKGNKAAYDDIRYYSDMRATEAFNACVEQQVRTLPQNSVCLPDLPFNESMGEIKDLWGLLIYFLLGLLPFLIVSWLTVLVLDIKRLRSLNRTYLRLLYSLPLLCLYVFIGLFLLHA